jgi:hypothetical protein
MAVKVEYNRRLKVSQKTVDAMNARKTFSGNIKYFKANKPSAEQREGLYRFYGRDRVNKALSGPAYSKVPPARKTGPVTEKPKTTGPVRRKLIKAPSTVGNLRYTRGNPKPTQADIAKGRAATKAASAKAAKNQASAISSSRGNPKPSASVINKQRQKIAAAGIAKRKSSRAAAAAGLRDSRISPKPSASVLNRASANKARKANTVVKAKGKNTRPTTGRYQRTPGGM